MNKAIITGHTSGIGKQFYDHLVSEGYEVIGFSKTNGHDIERDIDKIVSASEGCDVFINNAYANGIQLELFNRLYSKVKKIIVCGSIASDSPDPTRPEYSQHKKELKEQVMAVANKKEPGNADILLVQLSGRGYNSPQVGENILKAWLPQSSLINCFNFPGGEPN
jgi:hypothetical protein